MKKITLMTVAVIGLVGAASASVIWNPTADNWTRVGNVQIEAADRIDYTSASDIKIVMPNNGKSNKEVGFVSNDDINTMKGSALTADDTVIIKGVITQIAPTAGVILGNFPVVFGMNSAASFRTTDNLLFNLKKDTFGLIEASAFVDANKAATVSMTQSEILLGLTYTLTADKDGYTFLIDPNTATVDAYSVSGTFAGATDFVDNFGAGHFYLTVQRGDNDYTRVDITEASISVIPEPATLGLFAAFGGAILFIRSRFMI